MRDRTQSEIEEMETAKDLRRDDLEALRYCGRCNQRRYFKDGKCEMCAMPATEPKALPEADAAPTENK